MSILKKSRHWVWILVTCAAITACGAILGEDDDDSGGRSEPLDDRVPSDWNGSEDWSGSDWEVTEE